MVACDEQSPARGGEKEEPNEPPSADCKVIVYNGRRIIINLLDELKNPFYEYNSKISSTGYYLKPVHKVYKTLGDGRRRIYEYYGRYWWRRVGKRFVYAGVSKPRAVKEPPPPNPLDGLSIIVEGEDIILSCRDYEKFYEYFKGYKIEKIY